MNKNKKIFFLVIIFTIFLSVPVFASLTNSLLYKDDNGNIKINNLIIPSENNTFSGIDVTLENSQFDSSIFIFSSNKVVLKNNSINGDIFITGNNITIDGEFNNNIYIVSTGEIRIKGNIKNNLYVFGADTRITGSAGNDAYIMSTFLNIEKTASIGRDLNFSSTDFRMEGLIGRNFIGSSNILNLNGTIKGKGKTSIDNFNVETNAIVDNIIQNSNNKSISFLGNEFDKSKIENSTAPVENPKSRVLNILFLFGIIIFWSLIRGYFPRYYFNTDYFLSKKLFSALGYSIFYSLIIISTAIFYSLMVPSISIGIILIYLGLLCISSLVGLISITLTISKKFFNENNKFRELLSILFLALVYIFLSLLPSIFLILNFILGLLGLGFIFVNIVLSRKIFMLEMKLNTERLKKGSELVDSLLSFKEEEKEDKNNDNDNDKKDE